MRERKMWARHWFEQGRCGVLGSWSGVGAEATEVEGRTRSDFWVETRITSTHVPCPMPTMSTLLLLLLLLPSDLLQHVFSDFDSPSLLLRLSLSLSPLPLSLSPLLSYIPSPYHGGLIAEVGLHLPPTTSTFLLQST